MLATLTLSSFAGAATNRGKVWWPQFRGPNSSGLGEGKPPVHFGPDQNVLWKTAVGPGLSSPIIWERTHLPDGIRSGEQGNSPRCASIGAQARSCGGSTVAPEQIEKVHELSSPAGATPATDGERVYVYFGSYGLVSLRPGRKSEVGKAAPFAGKPLWRGRFTDRRR